MYRWLLTCTAFLVLPACSAIAQEATMEVLPPPMCPPAAGKGFCANLRHCLCRLKAHLCPDPGPFSDYLAIPSDHTHARAGDAQHVAWYSRPSDNGKYTMGKVGGGSPSWRRGDPPCAVEGTWGWDYSCVRNPFLWWWHGRKYQGGTGAYKTDGPHVPEPPRLYEPHEYCEK